MSEVMIEKAADMINSPPHYQGAGGLEAIDVIEAYGLSRSYHLGNAVKYILRAGKKGDRVTDLKKARWYLQRWVVKVPPPSIFRFKDNQDVPLWLVAESFGISGHCVFALHHVLRPPSSYDPHPLARIELAIASLDAAIEEEAGA